MSLSRIHLDDPAHVRLDRSGRTPAFFCRTSPVCVDDILIAELEAASQALGRTNVRICLHDDVAAPLHEMIILEYRDAYNRPHKHPLVGESQHIILGALALLVFRDDGALADARVLGQGGQRIYRLPADTYHAILPLSDHAVYHETKPGTASGAAASVFPSWAPDGSDREAAARYLDQLRRLAGLDAS